MFWVNDINLLFKPALIPTDDMNMDDKLNAITRLIVFICLIITLLLRDTRFILLMIILVLMIVVVYQYQQNLYKTTDTFLNNQQLTIVDKNVCRKPSEHNPFMNPIVGDDINNDEYDACPIYNNDIQDEVNDIYETSMYTNANDIYNRNTGIRQFYTVPASKIPNEQTVFANWLYNRGETCKENNGVRCYNNLYRDIRL